MSQIRPADTGTIKENLYLEGLHCADCAATVEKTIGKLGGVLEARVNFASSRLQVSYRPEQVARIDLVRGVERIGYKVRQDEHRSLDKRVFWKDPEFFRSCLSGGALAAGLFLIASGDTFPITQLAGRELTMSIVLLLLATLAGAWRFGREAWAAVKARHFTMDLLMSIAIVGAIIIEEYVEAATLAFLFSSAELLESYAVERARNSLRALMRVTPSRATVRRNDTEVVISAAEVQVGETVITRPGEKIAVDGDVIAGGTSVDQSAITGESVPVLKQVGDKVYAGSINTDGYLEIKTTTSSKDTMLARIIHLVEEAESKKAPSQRFVDRFARIYTPTVVAAAVLVAVVAPVFFGAAFAPWFVKALTLLVIACPCALVISTPVTIVSALTNASRNGILIKGGVYLEEMARVDAIAFDKTGTLTSGKLEVDRVVPLNGMPPEEILKLAASLEKRSEHPIARAIVDKADGMDLLTVDKFVNVPGLGVEGELQGQHYRIGRTGLFGNGPKGLSLPTERLNELQRGGLTTMLLGNDREIFGIIALRDQVRPGAAAVVAELQAAGKEVVLITGDNEQTANAIAAELGISHYHAGLLPEEKVAEIERLQNRFGKVAMIGDGINDAPALAAATVGIAMGVAGTDTALETADIALISDDLSRVPYLLTLSTRARRVINQNISASILIKLSLAAGVFPGLVSLVTAVLVGDMGATLGVTFNAMRLAGKRR